MKKLISLKESGYQWNYCSLGGVVRVRISSGEDIAHLDELDPKMWTALSCPAKDLHFDGMTLKYLDSDNDGKIKVQEVIAASKWLVPLVKDKDKILEGRSELSLDEIDTSTEEGRRLHAEALKILNCLGLEKDSISIDDTARFSGIVSDGEIRRLSAEDASIFPYGPDTAAALDACEALNAKVTDYFMRCKMIAFDEDVKPVLDVSVERIGSISAGNLSASTAEIAACPLARPRKSAMLPLDEINPSWQSAFNAVTSLVLSRDFKGRKTISEDEWNSILSKFDSYKAWLAGRKGTDMDKLVRYYAYFYKFLCNYVSFTDFYTPNSDVRAIFEAGRLYIDQRCCRLCIRVEDMAAHADVAGLSGMFLIYCRCHSKSLNADMNIVAVMTDGGTANLRPGKNAVFYDREGNDWDAVVTKIVDNPISIRHAFWTPYRKFANFVSEKILKSASDKEDKVTENLKADAGKVPFDIAKFAGIFAAIGMAVGYIGAFFTEVITGISTAPLWKTLLVILAILLCISGPSCFLAWCKLRRRNLGPVLNANGWAINAVLLVNILFGATLTSTASYPKLHFEDPFLRKKTPSWRVALYVLLAFAVVGAVLYFTDAFGCLK